MRISGAGFLVCLLFAVCAAQYSYNRLDELGEYEEDWVSVQWGVIDDDDSRLYFNVTAATSGWVGIGFNAPGQLMPGADFVIGVVADDDEEFQETTLTDRFANAFETPSIDDQQDAVLVQGSQFIGVTNFLFYREARNGDSQDLQIERGEQQQLLLAIGSSDGFSYHSRRTDRLVNLYDGIVYGSSRDGWEGDRVGHYRSDDGYFEIEWGFAGSGSSEVIVWKIKAHTTGWVGLGLSNDNSMPKSDMIVVSVPDDDDDTADVNKVMAWVQDRFVGDEYDRPSFDQSQDVTVLYAAQEDGYTYVSLARKVNTGDYQDRDISPEDDDEYMLWALGRSDEFNIHFAKGWTKVNWYSGSTEGSSYMQLFVVHGVLMIGSWLLLAVFSIGLVRYSKTIFGEWWLTIHLIILVLSLLLGVAGFIFAVVAVAVNGGSHFDQYHAIAGLLITFFAVLHPIFASVLKFPGLRDVIMEKSPMVNRVGLFTHRWIGWILVIFAIINIGTGLALYTTPTGVWVVFGLWIGMVCVYWFLLELGAILPGWQENISKFSDSPKMDDMYGFLVFLAWVFFGTVSLLMFIVIIVVFSVYAGDGETVYSAAYS